MRLTLDTSGDVPKACFEFSEQLDSSGDTDYADYVEFSPAAQIVAEVTDRTVCYAGLDFDKEYQSTLRVGLPSAKGDALEKIEELTISFGDKPAYVGFVGNGVILPRLEADGLGFETVNVDKLKIEIRRVGERALAFKNITEGESVAQNRYGYAWGMEDGEDVGVKLWEGSLDVKSVANETVTTIFPLGAALGEARQQSSTAVQPGAYFISVEDASARREGQRRPARSWRWVVFTDIALTSYYGDDGVDIVARSLKSGSVLAGIEVKLIAQNNDVLASGQTDANGLVYFSGPITKGEGPLAPKLIAAYGPEEDFAVLDLSRSALDLSDRNIGGRIQKGEIDSFLYFDRGIYRPGETAHISGIVRDSVGIAVQDRGALLEIIRPNNTKAASIRLDDMQLGGFSYAYEIPKSAPRGIWTSVLKVDGFEQKQRSSFSVEDFVPQRVAVELTVDDSSPMSANERRPINVEARFLYGAPGGGLNVEGEARLRIDPNPFPDFKDYSFGDETKPYYENRLNLGNTVTDGNGLANLTLAIDQGIQTASKPLRADIVVGVAEPGGRFVRESARIPVRLEKEYIGIRRSDKKSGRNEPVNFDIIVLNQQGEQISKDGLEWRIIEEDYRFEWYRQYGEWRWRRDYRDVLIATGTLDVKNNRAAELSRKLDYGSYRLEVRAPDGDIVTSTRFYAGWSSYASGARTPDQATLTVSEVKVSPGANARLTLAAPYAGEAMIAIATDKVHETIRVPVSERPREIMIETDPSWGSGFYVMASVITPRDAAEQPIPRRAMAVAYVPFDMSDKTLQLSFDTEEMVRPRQNVILPVVIEGATRGEEIMMTVAAVDEGILRLTKFTSPEPAQWFHGKKALNVRLYDDYGRLLNANLGAATRVGGDQLGGEGLTVVPTKSVSLFQGLVEVTGNGIVEVPIEIPDFNGELRLMAVAWSETKVGSSDKALVVRDRVPAELALPRFLGPNDTASTTLLIDNVDGKSGVYNVQVNGSGPVELSEQSNFNLATGQRQDALFSLSAGDVGVGDVQLQVSGPDDFSVTRSYPIQVRAPYFPVTEVETSLQEAGQEVRLDASILSRFHAGSSEVVVSYSPLNGIDPRPLYDSLRRYPYGCTEQLTSSSFPLLYADDLGAVVGEGPDRAIRPRVQEAINKILSRQSSDGSFGLWRTGDRYATGWVGVYVTDFLYRAKQEGYAVPDAALDSAFSAIKKLTSTDSYISVGYITRIQRGSIYADKQEYLRRRAAAYAFYVLARAGKADLSDLRYFNDSFLKETPNPLARAHTATALALMGDRSRATKAFEMTQEVLGYNNTENYYQSPLRDVAGIIALASEVENQELVAQLTDVLDDELEKDSYYNTQEQAFLLMATAALLKQAGEVSISVDGVRLASESITPSVELTREMLEAGVVLTNDGEGDIFRSVAVNGSPKEAPPAENNGFNLSKQVFTLSGEPVDLSRVRQNDRLIVKVSGNPTDQRLHPSIVVDMLPPGFEIETILRPEDAGERGLYRWLGDISSAKVSEARDDRFIAAIDLRRYLSRRGSGQFTFAYVVRAVTPGDYVFPGAVIEDMYRPGDYARTAMSRVEITAVE